MAHEPPTTDRSELANVLTHGVGTLLAIAGTVLLVVWAALEAGARAIVGVSVFGASMVLLYAASTAYHAARRPALKARLKVLDHASIYVLIAGTYTPFMVHAVGGGWGWSLFGVVWGLAGAGVLFKLRFTGRFPRASTAIYLTMGWLVLVGIAPLVRRLDPTTLAWLVAGGLAYTAGVPFYHAGRWRHAHAIWHLFVVAGTTCHAVAVGTIL